MTKIKYELQKNNGSENEDCLIITLGKALTKNYDLDDEEAKSQGWEAIEQGLLTMNISALQALHQSLRETYTDDFENIDSFLSKKPPEDLNQARSECQNFLKELKDKRGVKKGAELLLCIDEEVKSQNAIFIVDKARLEKNSGSIFLDFKASVTDGRLPQFIVCNGGHFSNVTPQQEDLETRDINIKESFIDMMKGTMVEAASFSHPKYEEQLRTMDELDEIPEAYSESCLDYDIKNLLQDKDNAISSSYGNYIKDKEPLEANLSNRKEFLIDRKNTFDDIRQAYSAYSDLENKSEEASISISKIQDAQIKLDEELAWKLQYEEYKDLNSSTEPTLLFMQESLKEKESQFKLSMDT